MHKKKCINQPAYSMVPEELEGVDALAKPALDMQSSRNHYADDIRRRFSPRIA